MKSYLLLNNGRYVKSYALAQGCKMLITDSAKPETIFNNAQNLKELIERFSGYKNIEMIPEKKPNKKTNRQMSQHGRLIASLKQEMERKALDTAKIDTLREQIENLEKNINLR